MNSKQLNYNSLKERLRKDFTWPSNYMFKFIVPFDANSLNEVKELFEKTTKLAHKESKSGKYISVTAQQIMASPADVIAVYRNAEKIKNIIAL